MANSFITFFVFQMKEATNSTAFSFFCSNSLGHNPSSSSSFHSVFPCSLCLCTELAQGWCMETGVFSTYTNNVSCSKLILRNGRLITSAKRTVKVIYNYLYNNNYLSWKESKACPTCVAHMDSSPLNKGTRLFWIG